MKSIRSILHIPFSGIFLIMAISVSCTQGKPKVAIKEAPSTDLHTAVVMGDMKSVQGHIDAESDLDVKDEVMASSPLMTAAVFGRTEIAKALIKGGASLSVVNNDSATALHVAAFLGRVEIVKMLMEEGVDANVKNKYGSSPLETVSLPFEAVRPIYDQFSKDLGPLGFKLDYNKLQENLHIIAELLSEYQQKE